MTKNVGLFIVVIILAVWAVGCEVLEVPTTETPPTEPPIITAIADSTAQKKDNFTSDCELITYPDSIYFLNPDIKDLITNPLVEREGEYGAIPEGLEIDKNSGEIRINKSESGLRYKVFFVPEKTTDTCFTYLTISGMDYISRIYILEESDSLALPIYRGLDANFEPDDETEFDDGDDDDDGDNDDDEPPPNQQLRPQGVDINKRNGKIRLDNTVQNGVFGQTPINGSNRDFRLYYRLNDNSKKALNKIDLKFHYFETLDDVPKDLKDRIEELQEYYSNFRYTVSREEAFKLFSKPRPPDIIIVARRRR